MHHANTHQNKALVAIFMSEKVNFRSKNITRDKERSFYNVKRVNSTKGLNTPNCLPN